MTPPLRRSLHFVPGANEKMLAKSLETQADCLVLDLEDAVVPERKIDTRRVVAQWLKDVDFGAKEKIVRMNPMDTPWGFDDLAVTMQHPPDAYLVPKPRTFEDIETIDTTLSSLERQLGHPERGVDLILIATETPQGVLNLPTFTRCPRVAGLSWGVEDLSAALGAPRNRDEDGNYLGVYEYCRYQTLLCAAAGGVQPIDTVYVDFKNPEGLARECKDGAWLGFTGKITIHPDQIPIVNQAFTPQPEDVAEAEALLEAFEHAQAEGRMAFEFNGQMVDAPHLNRAKAILARAKQAGVLQ